MFQIGFISLDYTYAYKKSICTGRIQIKVSCYQGEKLRIVQPGYKGLSLGPLKLWIGLFISRLSSDLGFFLYVLLNMLDLDLKKNLLVYQARLLNN